MKPKERQELLEQLKKEYPIDEQIKFNEFTIAEKMQENMKLSMQYTELLNHHQYILDKIMEKYDEVKCQRFSFYKLDYDSELTKTEIEQYYLPADEKLKKFNSVIEKQKLKVEFFKICVNAMEKIYWRMKTFIDNERI